MNFIVAIIGVVASAGVWVAIIVFAELTILEGLVAPAAGVDIQGWLTEFMQSQTFAVTLAACLALVWHLIATRCSGRNSDLRILWVCLWTFSVFMAILLCAVLLPDTQEGVVWAYAFAFLNGMVPFWLGTVWCTPGACKYAPFGAGRMRGVFGL